VVGQESAVDDRPRSSRLVAPRSRAPRRASPAPRRPCSSGRWPQPRWPLQSAKRVQFTPDLMPGDITGSQRVRPRTPASSPSARARSSPTCCWPTRSTAPRPRPRPRCWRRWRSARSPSTGTPRQAAGRRSSCAATHEPRRVRGHLSRSPRPSSTASCSSSTDAAAAPATTRYGRARSATRPASTRATSPRRGSGPWPGPPSSLAAAEPPYARVQRDAPEVARLHAVDVARATPSPPRRCQLGVSSPRGATALAGHGRALLGVAVNGRDFVTPGRRQGPRPRRPCAHRLRLRPEAELDGRVRRARCSPACIASVPVPALRRW
jgi:MoxR-like ATPase